MIDPIDIYGGSTSRVISTSAEVPIRRMTPVAPRALESQFVLHAADVLAVPRPPRSGRGPGPSLSDAR